jgi:hypothetical protein
MNLKASSRSRLALARHAGRVRYPETRELALHFHINLSIVMGRSRTRLPVA